MAQKTFTNALTIDFEDWYQGLEIPYLEWDGFEDRIDFVSDKLLQILSETNTKATITATATT